MALTTDQVTKVLIEVSTGKEPTILGEEADSLRKEIEQDIAMAKSKGWIIAMPKEWEVYLDGEKK